MFNDGSSPETYAWHSATGEEPEKAVEYYEKALEMIPKDILSLQGLQKACIASGDKDRADKIAEEIQKLKNP